MSYIEKMCFVNCGLEVSFSIFIAIADWSCRIIFTIVQNILTFVDFYVDI